MDKSIMYFVISLACFWLVLDYVWGNKYVGQFVVQIVPSAESSNIFTGGTKDKNKDKEKDDEDREDKGD